MASTSIEWQRRRWLALPLWLAISAAWAQPAGTSEWVDVWKRPACGDCKDWVTHPESIGFNMRTDDDGNTAARQRPGVLVRLGVCHTASIGGYAIEGHVPAVDIRRLLTDRPAAIGLAMTAMPVGSPGMDGPAYGQRKDPDDMLRVAKDGSATTYQRD